MYTSSHNKPLLLCTALVLLSGCDGEYGMSLPSIKLSGPVSAALAASDQISPAADGSYSVSSTLSSFPQAAIDDFANRFPGVKAQEQFRIVHYDQGVVVSEIFGIEGENAAETESIKASYNADGSFDSAVNNAEQLDLPIAILDSLDSLYPNSVIDESERLTDHNGNITYELELEGPASEYEVLMNESGVVLKESEEIDESLVPAAVVANARQELPDVGEMEFAKVIDNLGGILTFQVEVEREEECVELVFDESGNLSSITFELEM